MEDVDRAGGVSAILKEISRKDGVLRLDQPTVTGKTLGENIADAGILDPEVIRPIERAHSARGDSRSCSAISPPRERSSRRPPSPRG